MAEVESNGQAVGGLPQAHHQEAEIRSQNARRVSRRAQAASAAQEISRVSGRDLGRFGDTRKVGGRFETLQAVPERVAPERQGLDQADLNRFLQAFNIQAQELVLGQNNFLTSFGPGVLGITNP